MIIHPRTEFPIPLNRVRFSLDTSGVVGVFGGEQAVSAMGTIPLYKNWKWLGWYNSPGAYEIAKRYGGLAKSRFFDGLFPGNRTDPATLFEMDGSKGPKFEAAHSGTVIEETSHLAALFMKECVEQEGGIIIDGRKTQAVGVTIAELEHTPPAEVSPQQVISHSPFISSIPILVSLATCIMCAYMCDWFSFLMILLGMFVSGISCLVIGSGTLIFTHPEPAPGSPRGDGILCSEEIVLLKGREGAVNSITRGKFKLRFKSEPYYHDIGWCSVLLMIQFIAQLLLIPQGTLFGQVMFIISIATSWGHNMWLSSLNKENIQRRILINEVLQRPRLTRYIFPNRTSMVVFVLLTLHAEKLERLMNDLLPNETKVWERWKATVIERLRERKRLEFQPRDWEDPDFSEEEKTLLKTLYLDAGSAWYAHDKLCKDV